MPGPAPSQAPSGKNKLSWLARVLGFVPAPPPKARLVEAKKVLGSSQQARAASRLKKLPEKERKRYDNVIASAKCQEEKDYVTKALAANHSVDEIEGFAAKIRGKDAKWMQDHLKITGNSSGHGVKQQWSMSCNATTVQAVQAELDPIYALKLHEENKDITAADDADGAKTNAKLAAEQKKMLETAYSGKVAGLAGTKGKAASRGAAGGVGRYADDLLNARSATTGLKYSSKFLDAKYTVDCALKDVDKALKKGQPVPIVIGDGGANAYAHYVLITEVDDGPPRQYSIHDPWNGVTVKRSPEEVSKGKIDLAGDPTKPGTGWMKLGSIELPEEAK